MIADISRHLLESTLLYLLLCALAHHVCKRPSSRYAVLFIGVAKFAIPPALLAPVGVQLANLWPATTWVSSFASKLNGIFWLILGAPLSRADELSPMSMRLIFLLWTVGIAVTLTIWNVQFRRLRIRLDMPGADERKALDRVTGSIAVRAHIRMGSTDRPIGPALLGTWRPALVLPRGLCGKLTGSELDAVVLHELAHARRLDNLAATFIHLLVCIFWFHPLLWYAERQLARERECACDEIVLAAGVAPGTYVRAILKVCRFQLYQPAAGASHIAANDLKRRLELILHSVPEAPSSYLVPIVSACLVALMAIVPIAEGYCQQCVSTGQQGPVHVIKGDIR